MNYFFKSKTAAFAFGIAAIVMMSLAPASATTVVRDHREAPVVRDHRDNPAPVVRDHRGESSGGVVVKNSPPKRKPVDCLGNLCNVKKVCVGPACF
jgi:hypothetical protein